MKQKFKTLPSTKVKSRFRQEIKRHNHCVIITDTIDKGRYRNYVIAFYVNGERRQVRRASLAEARKEADFILDKLAQGEQDVLALTSTDRLIYLRACETLSKSNVSLDVAVSQYVHAEKILNGLGTLADAAQFFVKQRAGFNNRILVDQAVAELLKARRGDGSSPMHIDDLECRLGVTARVKEAIECCTGTAPLSAVFMCGSILEGVLLAVALKNPAEFNQAMASPKQRDSGKVRPFQEWTLANLIDVAQEVGVLRLDVKKFGHAVRDFRNYIHPYEQMASNFQPDEHTAQLCLQVLRVALIGLKANRGMVAPISS